MLTECRGISKIFKVYKELITHKKEPSYTMPVEAQVITQPILITGLIKMGHFCSLVFQVDGASFRNRLP